MDQTHRTERVTVDAVCCSGVSSFTDICFIMELCGKMLFGLQVLKYQTVEIRHYKDDTASRHVERSPKPET